MFPPNAGHVADVQVETLPPAAPNNPRGKRTFEIRPWENQGGVVFNNPQVTYYWREPHEMCGEHCHRGDNPADPDRNPEQIVFLLGSLDIDFEDLWGDKRLVQIRASAGRPVRVHIPPWVLHTFRVGPDGTHFIETKRNPFSKNPKMQDVCLEPEFRKLQAALQ